MNYYAVMPNWDSREQALKVCRIEKASDAREAKRLAYGRGMNPRFEVGHWLAKDLGSRVAVIQSDNKRVALLTDPSGWFDPFA